MIKIFFIENNGYLQAFSERGEMSKIVFVNGQAPTDKMTREGPAEFMRAYTDFIRRYPEHENLTPKGYAMLREYDRKQQERKAKRK